MNTVALVRTTAQRHMTENGRWASAPLKTFL